MTLGGGETEGTDAGSYDAIFTLKKDTVGTQWAGGEARRQKDRGLDHPEGGRGACPCSRRA